MITSRRTALAALAMCALGLASQTGLKLAIVNESPSLPRGLYLRQPSGALQRGAIVALPQPPSARAYLAGLGAPGDILLLKRIAGMPGDIVCASDGLVQVQSRQVAVRARDHGARALPTWAGCRPLLAGEVFLLGDTPDSFDSRYFGPVSAEDLAGTFALVVRW